jgi:CRISPR/Cas system-associated endoribonuclease Cas2
VTFYLLTYDLRKPDFDYQPLYNELARIKATRVQDSIWVLCSSQTAAELCDALWTYLHNEKDRLLVLEMSSDNWKSINAIAKISPLKNACE